MITKDELDKLLIEIEKDRVEKTISTNDANKFGEAICSFCNDFPGHNKPGYLIVGVDDDGSRCGLKSEERILQTLMDFRTDGRIVPPPIITVTGFDYPGGYVAVAEVLPSFQPPVRFKGKVCIRIGPRKGIATDLEERILSEKRSSFAHSYDTLPCYGSSLNDISIEIFKITYLPSAIDEETLSQNSRDIKEQLASLKFYDLKANCPTNAAILMFGNNPRFFIPGGYVQYVKFTGNDEVSEFEYERKFDGDLTTQLRVMDEFIKSQIVTKVLHNLGEEHQYNFPASAIKELLFYSVIHRDYQSNAPIKFYEFDDRIEISNAGGLFGKARPENFPRENDYRNPTIAEAAYNLGYVNRFNLGVQRASAALIKNGNPEPKFIFDQPTSFSVIIFKKKP
ncbi:ATP-binding protein [Lunatibacter salilacus]|uniref:ATP-binding protein n=1 Tax=Lunatibacter salilacus TaxID=2483804 RepID=UPI00131C1D1D|nr:ATP-binding protein [Lunatibacter salilacus]